MCRWTARDIRSHVCAYARLHHDQAVVAVVPRLMVEFYAAPGASSDEALWQDTRITVPSWKTGSVYLNLLTGERLETVAQGERQVLPMARVLKHCPVALLERCS